MKKNAIIGGSGVYNLDGIKVINEFDVDTPFGQMSSPVYEMELEGSIFYFICRHGKGHQINPSEINYRANIYGLKKIGVESVISISSVGSLKEEHAPGNFVLVDQFIDWTKGQRKRTFFENGVVGHVSVAEPIEDVLRKRIESVISQTSIKYSSTGTYVCIEGPQFSSKAESAIYRSFNADVIGMTNVPEAYLAKEAGLAYSSVGMVTDYDCWKDSNCTVEEIMKVVQTNKEKANELIKALIPSLIEHPIKFEAQNKNSIITNKSHICENSQAIVDVLLSE